MFFLGSFFKGLSRSHKISYLAVMVALSVVVNLFSFELAGGLIKLSFVSTLCLMVGAIFGPVFGFSIAFIGDLVAFLVVPQAFAYSPLIGISNGVYAAISGAVFYIFKNRNLAIKVIISAIIAYFICTLLISSIGVYILFGSKHTFTMFMYLRIIQTPVSVANAVVAYLFLKAIIHIKLFKVGAF